MHAGTARPAHAITPEDVARFVQQATEGLVLAAFGTVYGPTLRHEDMQELAQGFAALAPIRVLWPLKPTALPPGLQLSDLPLGGNTKVVPWVDYNVSHSSFECRQALWYRCVAGDMPVHVHAGSFTGKTSGAQLQLFA